jgi:tetratricopeptide (TPR) repeat protein
MNEALQVNSSAHYDFGYPSMMIIRNLMCDDFTYSPSDYIIHFESWATYDAYIGPDYVYPQFIWNFYYKYVLAANQAVDAVAADDTNEANQANRAIALAFRAHAYLDLAQMYEFLENDQLSSVNSDGHDVLHLTVPIVTQSTTDDESKNNPRATREKMFEFIKGDLETAEAHIANAARSTKGYPDLSVVYGLEARMYMWVNDYAKAQAYARKAIDAATAAGCYPLTAEQWHNTTTGFNTLSTPSWMWGEQLSKENRAVTSGIINWTSWMSGEATYGYSYANGKGPRMELSKKYYDRLSDTDFRKTTWKAPEGSALSGQEQYIDKDIFDAMPSYASLKFRPNDGDIESYTTGSASAYPLMRIEEMYLIEAEAAAQQNAAEGKSLLESFIKTYRDSKYVCNASSQEDVIDEIFFQKAIELWGEGLIYFDSKRLGRSITRSYADTNFPATTRFNTNGRAAWQTICIVVTEQRNNAALVGYNNPNPAGLYTPLN